MVYTVTVNPSLDYYITAEKSTPQQVNRLSKASFVAGGKGINVSLACRELSVETVCFGFVGGFTGTALENMLDERGIRTDFIRVDGETRVNVKLKGGADENYTEYNAKGPDISDSAKDELVTRICKAGAGDTVVLSGSDPHGLYGRIITSLDKSVCVIADTSGESLIEAARLGVHLLKPNREEAASLFDGCSWDEGARKLNALGAKVVITSHGGDGAYVFFDGKQQYLAAYKGEVKNSVGCGDSMIAGYIYACERYSDEITRARYAVAAGSATAFSPPGEICRMEIFRQLINEY